MSKFRKVYASGNQIVVFEAAARNLNFTRAADDLGVTQPAVSRMIGRFESYVGLTLFTRSPAGIKLTEDGVILYDAVSRGLDGINQAIEKLQNRQSNHKVVTISVSSAFATHWLIPKLGTFKQVNPEIDLRFKLTGGEPRGPVIDADIAVRISEKDECKSGGVKLVNEEILLVCSSSYAVAHGTLERPQEGATHTLLRFSNPRISWRFALEWLGLNRPDPVNELTFSDYSVVLQAALAGSGIALGWRHLVEDALKQGLLQPVCEKTIQTGNSYYLILQNEDDRRDEIITVANWIVQTFELQNKSIKAL